MAKHRTGPTDPLFQRLEIRDQIRALLVGSKPGKRHHISGNAATGDIEYRKTVSLSALQEAFGHAFPGQHLDLDRRVFMMHGVPATTKLPATVASLGPIPAQVTLPIACSTLVRQK